MDWEDYHEYGNEECAACAWPPEECEECGSLVHNQFDEDLEELEEVCEGCG